MRSATIVALTVVSLGAVSSLHATPLVKQSVEAGVETGVVLTAGKKSKAEKSCGTFMFRKDGKCVDARAKK